MQALFFMASNYSACIKRTEVGKWAKNTSSSSFWAREQVFLRENEIGEVLPRKFVMCSTSLKSKNSTLFDKHKHILRIPLKTPPAHSYKTKNYHNTVTKSPQQQHSTTNHRFRNPHPKNNKTNTAKTGVRTTISQIHGCWKRKFRKPIKTHAYWYYPLDKAGKRQNGNFDPFKEKHLD